MMRAVLVMLFVPAVVSFVRSMGVKRGRLRASDLIAILFVCWTLVALSITAGFAKASVSGTLICLEAIGGYVIVRAFFTERDDIKFLIRCLGKAITAIILIAIIDYIVGRNFVSGLFSAAVGAPPPTSEYRNGLLRATSTLDHSILYATVCAFAGVILYYGTEGTWRAKYMVMCVFGCLLGMSSAALLSAAFAVAIMIYDRLFQAYPWRWRVLLASIASAVLLLCLVKSDPVATLVRNFTLDAQTGFYRLLIWRYAGAEVMNSPWVGIGFRDWQRIPGMNGSVDALWLVFSLNAGIPMAVLYGLLILTSLRRKGPRLRDALHDPYLVRVGRGLSIVLSLVIITGFTVHFWGSVLTLLGVFVGLKTTVEEMRAREALSVLRASRQERARSKFIEASAPQQALVLTMG
jgi:hypothetical protein